MRVRVRVLFRRDTWLVSCVTSSSSLSMVKASLHRRPISLLRPILVSEERSLLRENLRFFDGHDIWIRSTCGKPGQHVVNVSPCNWQKPHYYTSQTWSTTCHWTKGLTCGLVNIKGFQKHMDNSQIMRYEAGVVHSAQLSCSGCRQTLAHHIQLRVI